MKFVKALKLTKAQLAALYYIHSHGEVITYSGTGAKPLKNLEKLGMATKTDCTPISKSKIDSVFSWKLTMNGKLYLSEVEEEARAEAWKRCWI